MTLLFCSQHSITAGIEQNYYRKSVSYKKQTFYWGNGIRGRTLCKLEFRICERELGK